MPKIVSLDPKNLSQSHSTYPPSLPMKGSKTVFVNNFGVLRLGDPYMVHINTVAPYDPHFPVVEEGSPTVFADGTVIARDGDALSCGDVADNGSTDVFADGGGGGGPAASRDPGETTGYSISLPVIGYKANYQIGYTQSRKGSRQNPTFDKGCPVDIIPEFYTPITEEDSGRKFKNFPGPPLSTKSGANLPIYATGFARNPIPITGLKIKSGSLPPGLVFNSSTGSITGKLTKKFNTTIVTFEASNFVGTIIKVVTFSPLVVNTC